MSLDIITICTDESAQGYRKLLKSAALCGFDIKNIWDGRPWPGLSAKPKLIKCYIETHACNDSTILFVDGLDTVFNRHPRNPIEVFRERQRGILFSTEKNCYPRKDWAHRFPPAPFGNKYLNSGCIIGSATVMYDMLIGINADGIPGDYERSDGTWKTFIDQEYFAGYYLDNPTTVGLDINCDLCLSLYPSASISFETEGVKNLELNKFPILIHGNGPSKQALKQVWDWLNL